ncbi:hypothetical protein GCM10020367_45220 [Streptomyces sannanensis]|uniref:Uncharacterized protein n=1 Tax=Streptomyces sannanensis TaxID=285536 RepID=A0ABP6SGC1_9ACTN
MSSLTNRYGYPGDPVNQYDLDGRNWFKKQWNRFTNKMTRVGRNPNRRSIYWSGKFAIGAVGLVVPFGRARTIKRMWTAVRTPRKTLKRCGASGGRFATCELAGWGVQTVANDFRNWNKNRRFRNDWNDSLTNSGREAVCRKYTGKRSCWRRPMLRCRASSAPPRRPRRMPRSCFCV